MKQQLFKLLRTASLKEEEIRIYLLLLKLEKATITQLVAESGLETMMVYRTIKRLHERGLIKENQLNKKQKIFTPLSLQFLINSISKKCLQLHKLQNSLRNLDPFLKFIDLKENSDDGIELKEGLDDFRAEYLKFPKICKNEYLHIGSMENYWKVARISYDSAEERNFIHQRLTKGIFARCLDLRSEEMKEVSKKDCLEKRTLKLKNDLPVMKNYLGFSENQAAFFICEAENPRVVVIKQPELFALYQNIFNNFWFSKD